MPLSLTLALSQSAFAYDLPTITSQLNAFAGGTVVDASTSGPGGRSAATVGDATDDTRTVVNRPAGLDLA